MGIVFEGWKVLQTAIKIYVKFMPINKISKNLTIKNDQKFYYILLYLKNILINYNVYCMRATV